MGSGNRGARVALVALIVLLIAAYVAVGQPKRESGAQGATPADAGLVVVAVDPGSPAENAGVKRGDVLLKADKIELTAAPDLELYVSRLKAGDTVALQMTRGGAPVTASVSVGDRNGRPYLGLTLQGAPWGGDLGFRRGLGPDGTRGGTRRGAPAPGMRSFAVEALVGEVVEGSPAAAAGIRQGDSILSVDGTALQGGGSLSAEVGKRKPGDKVTLEIRRQSGTVEKAEVTLGAATEDANKAYLGVRYQEVPVFADGGARVGLLVRQVAPGSPAEQAGIRVGDLISAVGEDKVSLEAPLADLIARHKPGDAVELTVGSLTGAEARKVTVTLAARPDDKEKAYLGVVTGGGRMVVPNDGQSAPRGRMWGTPRSAGRSDA